MTRSRSVPGNDRRPRRGYSRRRMAMAVAAPIAAMAAGVAVAGPASADTGNNGQFLGLGGMCLDDQGAQAVDFNPVQIFGCNGTAAQQWSYVAAGNTVQDFGMCLDVFAGGNWDGDTVDLYQCNGTGAQVWVPQSNGALFNPQSGKCLDDTGWGGPGTQLQIWDCTGGDNQSWVVPNLFWKSARP